MIWLHCTKNLVNLGQVTPKFKKGKDVHFSSISSFSIYAAPLLDLSGIGTRFSGAISTQFCFTYTLKGVTAIPRGLHTSLCQHFPAARPAALTGRCSAGVI